MGMSASPFGGGMSSPPPLPTSPSNNTNNTNPANIFAQMKSGTFANDEAQPEPSEKYDALRPGREFYTSSTAMTGYSLDPH
jgi:actin cytoskeleton-regulatory complex protein SLA1